MILKKKLYYMDYLIENKTRKITLNGSLKIFISKREKKKSFGSHNNATNKNIPTMKK